MSAQGITLDTPASERRNGRCVGCGQFTDRHTVHFHGPKRRFSGPPRAHLWRDGGGMVTRCDDPVRARELLLRKYAREVLDQSFWELDDDEREMAEAQFPIKGGSVERGRINVCDPDADYSWLWYPLPDDAKGPGITTAVVWAS